LSEEFDTAVPGMTRNNLVVVHATDGSLIKGTLQWPIAADHPVPLPHLPSVFQLQDEVGGTSWSIDLANTKAVFFVRTHTGNARHEEVRFFRSSVILDWWIQVEMTGGEIMEGRTENSVCLLRESGFWLWPSDRHANNILVYVPKGSVVEFHVMGCGSPRARRELVDLTGVRQPC